jgi:predicted phosphodiesterase
MLAILYDVHGNLPALEAVLADAESAGADRHVLGGDYALFGAWPLETVERLRGLDARWIRGNVDRWLEDAHDAPEAVLPAIERCRQLIGAGVAAELAALPPDMSDGDSLYVHASPLSDMRSFLPEAAEGDEELMAGTTPRRLVLGHTHLAFRRPGPNGVELVNPGSVGIPLDGDHRAAYALAGDDGSLELRRVAYDHAASARAVREVLGSAGETPARRIEQARFDVD